jgi:hypothetical protein
VPVLDFTFERYCSDTCRANFFPTIKAKVLMPPDNKPASSKSPGAISKVLPAAAVPEVVVSGTLTIGNLSDLFQKIMRDCGDAVVRVDSHMGTRYFQFESGAATSVGRSVDCPEIGNLLLSRDMIDEKRLEHARTEARQQALSLCEHLLNTQAVTPANIEEALRFYIDDELTALFGIRSGEYSMMPGAVVNPRKLIGDGVIKLRINPTHIIATATQTMDSWTRVAQRIPSQLMVFTLTQKGLDAVSSGGDVSRRRLLLLKAIREKCSVELLTQRACLGRLQTNDLLMDLWNDNLIGPLAPGEYIELARTHLRAGWFSEAERLVWFARGGEDRELAVAADTVLVEIAAAVRARNETTTPADADVLAPSKAKSASVKEMPRSKKALSVFAIAMLLSVAYFAYRYFSAPLAGPQGSGIPADVQAMMDKADALLQQQNFGDALRAAREFPSDEPKPRETAEKFTRNLQADIEARLRSANNLIDAAKGADREKQINDLLAFETLPQLSPDGEAQLARAAAFVIGQRDEKRWDAFGQRVDALRTKASRLPSEELARQYEALLAEMPPEKFGRDLREQLAVLDQARRDAMYHLENGENARKSGDLDFAREAYSRAMEAYKGGRISDCAEAGLQAIEGKRREAASEFGRIEALVIQQQTADAKKALKTFLQSSPPRDFAAKARTKLQELGGLNEDGAQALVRAIGDVTQLDPEAARQKISAVITEHLGTQAVAQATLRFHASSTPAGAEVSVNNRVAGTTPCEIDVNALGTVRITFRKAGFRPRELFIRDLYSNAQAIHEVLEPAAEYTRLPFVATGGIDFADQFVMLAGASEVLVYDTKEHSVAKRVKLTQPGPTRFSSPTETAVLPNTFRVHEFIALAGAENSLLYQVRPFKDQSNSMRTAGKISGRPVLYKFGDKTHAAFPTQTGYTCVDVKMFAACPGISRDSGAVTGIDADRQSVFINIGGSLLAFNAADARLIWEYKADANFLGAPLVIPEKNIVTAVNAAGKLAAVDARMGSRLWERDLGTAPNFGPVAAAQGVFVVLPGKLQRIDAAKGETINVAEFSGVPTVSPVTLKNPAGADTALIVAVQHNERHCLVAFSEDGRKLWQCRLDSAPVALATNGGRVYAALGNGVLVAINVPK